jgi:hypothetical protein
VLSAFVLMVLTRWTVTEHRRCGVIPAQANGLGSVSEDDTRAEGPIHPLGGRKMVQAFSPQKSSSLDPSRWPVIGGGAKTWGITT